MCLLIRLFLLFLVLAIQEKVKLKVVIRHLLLIYGRNLCQRALSYTEHKAEIIIGIKKSKFRHEMFTKDSDVDYLIYHLN